MVFSVFDVILHSVQTWSDYAKIIEWIKSCEKYQDFLVSLSFIWIYNNAKLILRLAYKLYNQMNLFGDRFIWRKNADFQTFIWIVFFLIKIEDFFDNCICKRFRFESLIDSFSYLFNGLDRQQLSIFSRFRHKTFCSGSPDTGKGFAR